MWVKSSLLTTCTSSVSEKAKSSCRRWQSWPCQRETPLWRQRNFRKRVSQGPICGRASWVLEADFGSQTPGVERGWLERARWEVGVPLGSLSYDSVYPEKALGLAMRLHEQSNTSTPFVTQRLQWSARKLLPKLYFCEEYTVIMHHKGKEKCIAIGYIE